MAANYSLPTRTKAIRVIGSYDEQNLNVESVPLPSLKRGEVLIRVEASPINPSDVVFIKGKYRVNKPLPTTPGFEACGTVMASGGGFLPWWILGKRVACATNVSRDGAWAEYLIVEASRCVPVGDNDPDVASCSFINPLTALGFLECCQRGNHKVIIQTAASSSLGKMTYKLLTKNGITVINVVRRAEQAKLLTNFLGSQHVLDSSSPTFDENLKECLRTLQPTCFFEAVCGDMTDRIFRLLPTKSEVIVYGMLSNEPIKNLSPQELIYKNKRVSSFNIDEWMKSKSLWEKYFLVRRVQNELKHTLKTEIFARFDLSQHQEALDTYKKNMSRGKVVFRPHGTARL